MAAFEVRQFRHRQFPWWSIVGPDGEAWDSSMKNELALESQCRRLNKAYELGCKHERYGRGCRATMEPD